jgi:uncharacterized coiled-coil protein SlyX
MYNLEKRIENLEKLVASLVKKQNDTNSVSENYISSDYQKTSSLELNTEINTETLDTVMETVIPTQSQTIDEVSETLDTLMTDIIPLLMMGDE